MTGAEITLRASAGAVVVALSDVVSAYRRSNAINRGQLDKLKLELETALRVARSRALYTLTVENLEGIANIQRLIDSLHLEGPALEHAMRQFEQLSLSLASNLRALGHE